MLFNNPLSSVKANQFIQLLDISPNGRILDIGCGDGEFLIQVIEAWGARGLGSAIDSE